MTATMIPAAERMMDGVDVMADDNIEFEYAFVPVSDLEVRTMPNEKSGKVEVVSVVVQGEPIIPTNRFWTSLFARYGFNSAFFKYFDHAEVFQRISERERNDNMRLCIERGDKGNRLLAVSNPTKPVVSFSELRDILTRYGGTNVTYAGGLIESRHTPRNGGNMIEIGGDEFASRFILSCPIDGYGLPNVYLGMLRELCQNGLVAYSKVFRSSLALGKGSDDVAPSLVRVLEGFGNDEGYAALRQRIESAQKSWASVYEALSLNKLLYKLHASRDVDDLDGRPAPKGTTISRFIQHRQHSADADDAVAQAPIFRAYSEMTGEVTRLYGIANPDALSPKRQRTLPVRCTMYDLVNFATEVATHYSQPEAARSLHAWVGTTISGEYDMENTRDKFTEFTDFHINAKNVNGLTGSEHADVAAALN